jgi:hypothetical protein
MPVDDRQASVEEELQDQVYFSERKASLNHYASLALMGLALGCTIAASVLGIFSLASARVVGGLAGLPAVIAFVAITLQLEAKSSWHYQKAVKTRTLLRRLRHQGPDPMTIEYIAGISEEFNLLDETMAEERLRNLTLNWRSLLQHRASLRSDGSSVVPATSSPGPATGKATRRLNRRATPPQD